MDIDLHIARTLIDMMETAPFEQIKVAQLVRAAGISRSTFYNHYDSIYDVLQSIEDDFIANVAPEHAVGARADLAQVRSSFSYIADNLRTFRILTGPNGDPSFEARLANRGARIFDRIATELNSSLSPTQLAMVNEYQRAGKMAVFQWWAEHRDEVSVMEVIGMLDSLTASINAVVQR